MPNTHRPTLSVRSPADLIAAVPYLLGFHPADSLVVVAMRGTRVAFAVRYDLPAAGDPPPAVAAQAGHVARVVCRQGVDSATVLGYGPAARVTPGVAALVTALGARGTTVLDELRVTDGRFWSYRCAELSCCPAEGTACHPDGSVVAAAATFAGQVALPDRAALVTRLSPVGGPERAVIRAATAVAEQRRHDLLSSAAPSDVVGGRALRRAGETAVREALRRHRDGAVLDVDDVAWLGVVLTHLPVRDRAWEQTGEQDWHVSLWTDVVRRVEPGYVAAPACLLAFAAWRTGQGALASVALERAREQQPDYPMAVLLDEVLQPGLPPSVLSVGRAAGGFGPGRPARRARRPRPVRGRDLRR
jgi:hypothetical protein